MVSVTVFGISLLGLVAIVGCKALELGRNVNTPLTLLRRVLDPVLTNGWANVTERTRKAARAMLRASILWIATTAHDMRVAFDATVHAVTARLNRYLRTRRLHLRRNGEVSAHLKTVLEKTETNTEPPRPPSS